jgi:hypothetical protein
MWLVGFIGFILFVPHGKRREGYLAFLMFQAFIWACDIPSFTYGLLSAPFREFPKATNLCITINYFFYPVLFSIYYVHRRVKSNRWSKIISFFIWTSTVTLFDIVIEKYTDLLEYGTITWYGMWMYIVFLYYVSEVCCDWFYKGKPSFKPFVGGANEN